MLKKIKKKYHESSFKKSVMSVKNKPLLLFYILLLDAAFFAIFWILNYLVNTALPSDPLFVTRFQSSTMLLIVMFLLTVLYFVIIILIYSFFSLIILGNIKKFAFNHKHDLSLYKRMFFLNLVLFIMFFILLVIFNIILTLIINKSVWIASIIFVLMALIIIMAYAFYNFSHSAFILGHELRSNLKQSFRNIFTKSYWGIILFNLIILGIYVLVYILLGAAFGDIIATNYTQYVNTSSIVSLVLIYVLYTFNRIYFFFITEKKLGIKKSSAHD